MADNEKASMTRFLVSGLINIETTLQIDRFPNENIPVRYPFYGISSSVSGVGLNVARALAVLGNDVQLISIIGQDYAGQIARKATCHPRIDGSGVLALIAETPQSIILYDREGKRQINVDLKDIQGQSYPIDDYLTKLASCDAVILCNINFSRPFLRHAKDSGKLIATDVHAVSALDSTYDQDFMAAADILFMSDEQLPCPAEEWLDRVMATYKARVVVIGMGSKGALVADRDADIIEHFPVVSTRPVINTIGAGDALFASFMHAYMKSHNVRESLNRAMIFASYKIGTKGAAAGFVSDEQLQELVEQFYK
jgi:ribokinase